MNNSKTPLMVLGSTDDVLCFMHNLQNTLNTHNNDLRTLKESKMLHRFAEAALFSNWQHCADFIKQSEANAETLDASLALTEAEQGVKGAFDKLYALSQADEEAQEAFLEDEVYDTKTLLDITFLLSSNSRVRLTVNENTQAVEHGIIEVFGMEYASKCLKHHELEQIASLFSDKIGEAIEANNEANWY